MSTALGVGRNSPGINGPGELGHGRNDLVRKRPQEMVARKRHMKKWSHEVPMLKSACDYVANFPVHDHRISAATILIMIILQRKPRIAGQIVILLDAVQPLCGSG